MLSLSCRWTCAAFVEVESEKMLTSLDREERDFTNWSHTCIKEKLNAVSWKNGEDTFSLTADAVTGDVRTPCLESLISR